jgi:hypothetical protein
VIWRGATGSPHSRSDDPALLDIERDEVLKAAEARLRGGPGPRPAGPTISTQRRQTAKKRKSCVLVIWNEIVETRQLPR